MYRKQPVVEHILTAEEAAALLRVSSKTLLACVKDQRVPHFKLGKQFRFVRSQLLEWAEQESNVPSEKRANLEQVVQ
jgi:excisionase family DNA binding protein